MRHVEVGVAAAAPGGEAIAQRAADFRTAEQEVDRAREEPHAGPPSELVVVRKPLLQLARLAERLLQHPLVDFVQLSGSIRFAAPWPGA